MIPLLFFNNMKIIVATDENNAIGLDNQLPWHLPADLKRFKSLTQGNAIIMGRKTFDSIGRPLPNRLNIVVSKSTHQTDSENLIYTNSLEKAIEKGEEYSNNPFIIGGGNIYKQALNLADTIELTLVHTKLPNADTHFPAINPKEWEKTSEEFHPKDEKNDYDFSFITYIRKK